MNILEKLEAEKQYRDQLLLEAEELRKKAEVLNASWKQLVVSEQHFILDGKKYLCRVQTENANNWTSPLNPRYEVVVYPITKAGMPALVRTYSINENTLKTSNVEWLEEAIKPINKPKPYGV